MTLREESCTWERETLYFMELRKLRSSVKAAIRKGWSTEKEVINEEMGKIGK